MERSVLHVDNRSTLKQSRNPTRRVLHEKIKEQWRAAHEMQQDSDSSDRECDVLCTRVFILHNIR